MDKITPVANTSPHKRHGWVGFLIMTGIVLVCLTVFAIYLLNIKATLKNEISTIMQKKIAAGVDISAFENTRDKRLDFLKKRHFLELPLKVSYSSADFIRRLGLIEMVSISLTDLYLRPGHQKLFFTLKGLDSGRRRDPGSETDVDLFINKLSELDRLVTVSLFSISQSNKGVSFTIRGEIDLP